MKKVFLYIISVSTITFFTCAGIFYANPVYPLENDYFMSIIKKEHRLKTLASPKIILVGGSNLAFGIDSKKISDSLNMPVMNMGIGAALGLEFELNEVRAEIKKGDIIIVSEFPGEPNYEAIYKILAYSPGSKNGIRSLRQYYNLAKAAILVNVQSIQNTILNLKSLNPKLDAKHSIADSISVYFKDGFNEQGDLISHLNNHKPARLIDTSTISGNFNAHIRLINNFADLVNSKSATLFYIDPPYPVSMYKTHYASFDQYANLLNKKCKAHILGKLHDSIYPDSLFFDSNYHLDSAGRSTRTDQLISFLSKSTALKNSCK